jgi:hypothetical protein
MPFRLNFVIPSIDKTFSCASLREYCSRHILGGRRACDERCP